MSRIPISAKLLGGFLAVTLIFAAVGIFAIVQMEKISAASNGIAHNWLPSIGLLKIAEDRLADFRLAQLEHNLAADDSEKGAAEREISASRSDVSGSLDAYEAYIDLPQEKRLFDSVKRKWMSIQDDNDRVFLPMSRRNGAESAGHLRGPARQLFESMESDLEQLTELNASESRAASARADDLSN
jgi:hypothetical protein